MRRRLISTDVPITGHLCLRDKYLCTSRFSKKVFTKAPKRGQQLANSHKMQAVFCTINEPFLLVNALVKGKGYILSKFVRVKETE